MNDKLIILGSKGMLGQMVKKYFEKEKFDITCFDQKIQSGKQIGIFGFSEVAAFGLCDQLYR